MVDRRALVRRLAPIAVPIVLIVVLLGPQLIGARSLASTDYLYAFWPWAQEQPAGDLVDTQSRLSDNWDSTFPKRAQNKDRLLEGDLPVWTPYSAGGSDLSTNAGGLTFASATIAWFAVPDWYGPGLAKALELLGAWGFVYLFARRLAVGRGAASLGGLVFAICGFQVVWINWQHTTTNMWVAGCLWSWDRVRERPTDPTRIGVAALTTGFALVEGFPAVAIVGLAAVAAIMVILELAAWPGWRSAARSALGVGGSAALGAGLSAIVLVPFSSRVSDYGLDRSVVVNLKSNRAIGTVLSPNALGPADRYFGPGNYVESVGYLAPVIVAIIAAGVAVALVERRRAVPIVLLVTGGVLGLAISYGFEPLYDAVRVLPILDSNPAGRVKATASLVLTVAAALCLDTLRSARASTRSRVAGIAAAAVAVAACLLFLYSLATRATPETRDFVQGEILRAAGLLVLGLAAVAVLLWRQHLPRIAPRLAIAMLLVAVLADGAAWIRPYWPSSRPDDFYPTTAAHEFVIDRLGDDRLASLESTFVAGTNGVYGFRTVHGHTFQTTDWKAAVKMAGATFDSETNSSFHDPASATSPMLDRLGATLWAESPDRSRCVATGDPTSETVRLAAGATISAPADHLRGAMVTVRQDTTEDTLVTITSSTGEQGTTLIGPGVPNGTDRYLAVPESPDATGTAVLTVAVVTGAPLDVAVRNGSSPLAPCSAESDDDLRLAFADGANVYERLNARHRVRWAPDAVVVEDRRQRLDDLRDGTFPVDTVVLSTPTNTTGGGTGTVERVEIGEDVQRYRTQSDGPGWLVVADPIQSGWRAELDGREVELLPADQGGVAIAVPAGDHEIVLEAAPPGLRAGKAISGLSALAVAALLGLGGLRAVRRRRRAPRVPDTTA